MPTRISTGSEGISVGLGLESEAAILSSTVVLVHLIGAAHLY